MRFTSHLDLILTWERTFRRANLPLALSEGYTPRPQMVLAAPLPLGFTSLAELGDFWLSDVFQLKDVNNKLLTVLPPGLGINQIDNIPELYGPKLPALVQASEYSINLSSSVPDIQDRVNSLWQSNQFPRVRKNKKYDLRPLILDLKHSRDSQNSQIIEVKLSLLPGASGRPDEVVKALKIPLEQVRITRTKIILKESGGEG